MNSWQDVTEITTGLIIDGRLSLTSVSEDMFYQPYDKIIGLLKSGKEISDVISIVGPSPFTTAHQAVVNMNGLGESVNWADVLKTAYLKHTVGSELEKYAKKLLRGDEVSVQKIVESASKLSKGVSDVVTMDDVEEESIDLIPSGLPAIDEFVGGWPKIGLATIGAPEKTGKTTFMLQAAKAWLDQYPDAGRVMIFSCEMSSGQLRHRMKQLFPEMTADERKRIVLCDTAFTANDVAEKASITKEISLIAVDFADLLVQGEVTSGAMELVYRVLATLALQKKVPILLLAQLNRGYQGGVPRPYHLRWSGMAEKLSFMAIMLYNQSKDYSAEKDKLLPLSPGDAFICFWLSRAKTKRSLPVALQVGVKDEDGGWDVREAICHDISGMKKKAFKKPSSYEDVDDWDED